MRQMLEAKRAFIVVIVAGLFVALAFARSGASMTPATPTPTATVTVTPTVTPTRTATPSPTPTSTPLPPTPTIPPPPTPTPCPNGAALIYHGNTGKMMVALTFDLESTAGYTQQVLDTLAAKGVRATFAVTGGWAQSNPGLLQEVVAGGHQIMNHSMDHASFTGKSSKKLTAITSEQRLWELQSADAAIQAAAGVSPKPFFRPPYGDYDASVLCDAAQAGYTYVVVWNADTRGFVGASIDQIVQTGVAEAKPGAIYVMHVASNSADALALPLLIDALIAKGYSFGTVDEVLR
jgi:peptidoglycan/xylan/chitin deacetylase (PgdA/CDA1 family)